jgi:hypothetical protein
MTTLFDAAGKGSAKACWALMRRATADKFESASFAANPSPFQEVCFEDPKNRTGIGPHLKAQKRQ